MQRTHRHLWVLLMVASALFGARRGRAAAVCVGDCDGDGTVTVNEVIAMVDIALGTAPVSSCVAGDADGSGTITVDEIVAAVNNALGGCSS